MNQDSFEERRVSLYVLLGTIGVIGVLFFRVITPFIFSLLFAAVMAVLCRPLHRVIVPLCLGRRRFAAAVTTLLIVLAILIPLVGAVTMAGLQLFSLSKMALGLGDWQAASPMSDGGVALQDSHMMNRLKAAYESMSEAQRTQLQDAASQLGNSVVEPIYQRTLDILGNVIGFVVGFLIMALALYYFLADGEALLLEVQRLSPLGEAEEVALFEQFENVCRGVVMGSVVAALVQAVLAGVGFAIAGVSHVWLLMALTMFFSFIPFLGAGSVCTAVSLGLLLDERYVAAALLFVYSMAVVTTVDNLIKAHVIGNGAQLNPLVVLITVVGALQLIGLWGIFVGPMVAAFFYALLTILHDRLLPEAPMQPDDGAAIKSSPSG